MQSSVNWNSTDTGIHNNHNNTLHNKWLNAKATFIYLYPVWRWSFQSKMCIVLAGFIANKQCAYLFINVCMNLHSSLMQLELEHKTSHTEWAELKKQSLKDFSQLIIILHKGLVIWTKSSTTIWIISYKKKKYISQYSIFSKF